MGEAQWQAPARTHRAGFSRILGVELKKPVYLSEEEWKEHLKEVDAWTGYDGLSADDVSELLLMGSDKNDNPHR